MFLQLFGTIAAKDFKKGLVTFTDPMATVRPSKEKTAIANSNESKDILYHFFN
jgi:hypothetical protein